MCPCRRFALPLTGQNARLGGDVIRYVFIVEDLHLLLLAGLPAHYQRPHPMTVLRDGIGRTNRRYVEARRVIGLGRWYYPSLATTG